MRWALAAVLVGWGSQADLGQTAARAQVTERAPPIELPPMFVEGVGRGGPQWRHAEGPGFEVLSCCDDEVTVGFMSRTLEQQALLGELVPRELQRQTLAPTVVILLSDAFAGTMSAEMAAEMRRNAGRADPSGPGGGAILGLPQLRLSETDSDMSYFILSDHGARAARRRPEPGSEDSPGWLEESYEELRLAPEFVTHLMVTRAPPLPLWYIAGVSRLYRSTELSESEIELGPADWSSAGEAERLREDPHAPRTLLPMAEVFDPVRPLPADPSAALAYRRLWFDEAALFVRWALDRRDPGRRAALARWADAEGPDRRSEAYFRTCFGLGWADLRDRLSDYLPVALRRPLSWRPAAHPALPQIQLRAATPGEIRRIKGEWERREVAFIRERHPEFLSHYIERARTSLTRALEAGDRDPRLLASLGLLDAEVGDGAGARKFLEAAVQANVVRPRAAVELARVRLAEWVEAAGGAAGTGAGAGRPASPTLRPDQAATVLAPLLAVSAELPPQREAYYLLSEVARLSQGEPGPEIRAGLREGVRLFPDTRGLALAAAVWEYRAGDRSAALRMVELGLAAAPIGPDRDRLLALRRRLDGGVATPGTSAAPVDPWSAGWMTTAAIAGLDPRDRRDLGLSPDGRHLAYLAPFGGRIEQLIIVDLDRPTAPVSVRLPRAPHAEAGPLSGSRGRQGGLAATGASSGLGGSGGFGASGGSARSAGSAGLARSADWSGDRAVSAPAGSIPVAAPRLAWTPAGRIAVALGARAVFAIEATGSGLRWLRPKDPEFASVALPASVAAPSPAASAPVLDRRSQNLVGRRVPTAASRTYWSDPQLAAVQAELESKLPDRRISLLDWDQARSRFLALAQTQDGNGRCFVFRPADQLLLEVPLEGPTG